jgi:hypothetical protein
MGSTRAQYRGNVLSYYDSTTHETTFRAAPVGFVDDFIGSDVAIPAAASPESGCKWVKKIVGAAPPTLVSVGDALNGVIACTLTADDQKQNAEIYTNDELQFSVLQGLVFEARFALAVVPTLLAEVVIGVTSAWADGLDATTVNAFVTCDGSGLIVCETDDAATDGSTSSGVTLTADQYAVVRIDCTDAATAGIKFYVNGALVHTSAAWAANAATSKVQPMIGAYKASGAGLATLNLDYVKIHQNRA